ncbi:EamA family transporter [candidate division KSB3 bacterium]|uniref:EamA family transporter n=1 Tax=candidate division KSB3 bacterium TaxID=2044937 RepID=A0A9D5Q7P0_9BACT|nr:EamA family transporter [candidate division KSB3 bacterium]MBD3326116.1 EamA family transporter [candidate division KSB3 bacterium]
MIRNVFRRLFDSPYVLLPLAPLFWSSNFILGRAMRADIPPVGLAFWRWAVGSALIIGVAWPHLRRDWPRLVRHWKIIGLLAILGVTAFNTLAYTGLRFTTAINGLLMQSTMPVIIVLMSYLLFRETIRPLQAGGIILSLSGVLTIITQGNPALLLTLSLNIGDLILLIAVTCYAAYSTLLRKRPALHPLSFLAATFLVGMILLLPFYLWEHFTQQVMPVNRATLLSIAYVAVFPSILAYLCFNRGVELLGANQAGLFLHLMPVFGSIMAILVLGERLEAFHALGIGLIIAGILLATQIPARSPVNKVRREDSE